MQKSSPHRCSVSRVFGWIQLVLGVLVVVVSVASLARFYSAGFFLRDDAFCRHFLRTKETLESDFSASSSNIYEIHVKIRDLYGKVDAAIKDLQKNMDLRDPAVLKSEYDKFRKLIIADIKGSLDAIKVLLQRISSLPSEGQQEVNVANLEAFFSNEELKNYMSYKENRIRRASLIGVNGTFTTIGHGCFALKKDLEQYMSYDVGGYCKDDWSLGQKLMLQGCDPLPRRRCLARTPKLFQKLFPISESLWNLPDDKNVRWDHYQCQSFECLANKNTRKGFFKCSGCFNLSSSEAPKWVTNTSNRADFLISDVLGIKPGEIRIGMDFSVGVGTFAARMREHNVTIVSTALNLGAPFNEIIALRGLVPLYIGINQRLPFFDNTLDLIHTGGFLDAWIDLQMLDFVVFDWDRVLRPGGFLWIDKFFCTRSDLDDYLYMFLQLRYKKHRWVIIPKTNTEVYFSAVLEKPPRPF